MALDVTRTRGSESASGTSRTLTLRVSSYTTAFMGTPSSTGPCRGDHDDDGDERGRQSRRP